MSAHPGSAAHADAAAHAQTLDLGLIGNGSIAALVDGQARIVWGCVPAFDGDPTFCTLLSPSQHPGGDYAIELETWRAPSRRISTTPRYCARCCATATAERWRSPTSRRAGTSTTASTVR